MVSKLVSSEELRLLRLIKKKKRLTTKDAPWWTLDAMMRKSVLNKIVPRDGSYAGWPYFILAPRGRRVLERVRANEVREGRSNDATKWR